MEKIIVYDDVLLENNECPIVFLAKDISNYKIYDYIKRNNLLIDNGHIDNLNNVLIDINNEQLITNKCNILLCINGDNIIYDSIDNNQIDACIIKCINKFSCEKVICEKINLHDNIKAYKIYDGNEMLPCFLEYYFYVNVPIII